MAIHKDILGPILFQNRKKCEKSIRKFYESFLLIFCVSTILNNGFILNSVDALEHHTGELIFNLHNQLSLVARMQKDLVDIREISSQKFFEFNLFFSLYFLCIAALNIFLLCILLLFMCTYHMHVQRTIGQTVKKIYMGFMWNTFL